MCLTVYQLHNNSMVVCSTITTTPSQWLIQLHVVPQRQKCVFSINVDRVFWPVNICPWAVLIRLAKYVVFGLLKTFRYSKAREYFFRSAQSGVLMKGIGFNLEFLIIKEFTVNSKRNCQKQNCLDKWKQCYSNCTSEYFYNHDLVKHCFHQNSYPYIHFYLECEWKCVICRPFQILGLTLVW